MDRSTKRISKLQAELDAEAVLLRESRARLARLEAQQAATPATPGDTARGAQVVNLQQMVNQLQAERDALCAELRQSRVAKDRTPWSGGCASRCDHDPCIARRPPGHRRVDGFKKPRFAGRPRVRVSGRDLVLLAQGAAKLAVRRASALALQSMEVQTSLGSRMGEDLTCWFREHGFPGAQPGNHFTARAQERVLQHASAVDARVALLESVFVTVAFYMGRQEHVEGDVPATGPTRAVPGRRGRFPIAGPVPSASW